MPLSIELLKCMSDEHMLNALRADFDPLASTELEKYLIERVGNLIEESTEHRPYMDVAENYGVDADEFKNLAEALIDDVETTIKLLRILSDAGMESPKELTAEMELAKKVHELASV